jgi:hypothetical protein
VSKSIKARAELGVNSIMDPVMVPDGFSRVCDGLDLRSGVARAFQLPHVFKELVSPTTTNCIWEYRNQWYESALWRTYHGEYINAQQAVYFTEEGINHLPPQKIIDGTQVRLGIRRPIAEPLVAPSSSRFPTSVSVNIAGAGGAIAPPIASYRVAAMVGGNILAAASSAAIHLTVPSSTQIIWGAVPGADGYAIFGRTPGSERLLIELGKVTSWIDDGTTAEGSSSASSYDSVKTFQYVYTYYRKVGLFEDESGPSPLSVVSSSGKISVITRLPLYDGLYSDDSTTYHMATNALTATLPAGSPFMVDFSIIKNTITTFTTRTAHGMATGQAGRLFGAAADVSSSDLVITTVSALVAPVVAVGGYPAGGTVPLGPHTYKVTAVRGLDPAVYLTGALAHSPAQTTATGIVATVTGVPSSVTINITSYTQGTDMFIVYRSDDAGATFTPKALLASTATSWVDTGAAWPVSISAAVIPATNETATRCFTIPQSIPMAGGYIYASLGMFQSNLVNITLATMTGFTPAAGDLLYADGLTTIPEINGANEVVSFAGGVVTVKKYMNFSLSGSSSVTGTLTWRSGNGSIKGWRIYRVGDTAEFLRVADLSLSVTSFTDTIPTEKLGVVIPTAYTQNGLYVVYDWAPTGLKRMVKHFGMRFGIVDDLVRWTPTNVPDAWPDVFYAAFPSKPVNIASYRGILSVVCEGGLYALVGNTPSTISPAGPFSNLGCFAPFTLQASNAGLMWLTKTGIAISRDGMSASCLTSDKVSGRYFYSPSTPVMAGVLPLPVGLGWHLQATQTVQFTESMREERIDYSMAPVQQVDFDLPANAEMTDIHSFYWNDRYVMYYAGVTAHARSGCAMVDMSQSGMPISTLPVKPLAVHVSSGGDCYMLLAPRPVTTATITSPI